MGWQGTNGRPSGCRHFGRGEWSDPGGGGGRREEGGLRCERKMGKRGWGLRRRYQRLSRRGLGLRREAATKTVSETAGQEGP